MKKIIIYTLFFGLLNSIQGMNVEQEIKTINKQIQNIKSDILKIRNTIVEQFIPSLGFPEEYTEGSFHCYEPSEESTTNISEESFYDEPSEEYTNRIEIIARQIGEFRINSPEQSLNVQLTNRIETVESLIEKLSINVEQSYDDQQNKLAELSRDIRNSKVSLARFRKSMIQETQNYIDEEEIIEIIEKKIQKMLSDIEIQSTTNSIDEIRIREIIYEIIQQILYNQEDPIDGEMTQRMLYDTQSPINEKTIQRMIKNISYIMVRFNQLSKKRQNLNIELQKQPQISKGNIILIVFLTYITIHIISEYLKHLLYAF